MCLHLPRIIGILRPCPPLNSMIPALEILRLRRMPPSDLAYFTSYERIDETIQFILDPNRHPHIDFHKDPVSVVGEFNNWGDCPNRADFELISEAPHSNQVLIHKNNQCQTVK